MLGPQDQLPFGEEAGVAGESEKHRFTNYERDGESGMDYAVNRQYQSSTGRFMRPDPVAGNIADPQSLNGYSYVINDPINLVDPLGLLFADPGGCSAQYSSCGEVTVCINGWCFPVPVGYDGGGGGTFLWGQLPQGYQARLSDIGPLPKAFQIFPSFADFVRPTYLFDPRPGIIGSARGSAQEKITAELKACDEVKWQTFDRYLLDPQHPLNLRELQARPRAWKAANGAVGVINFGSQANIRRGQAGNLKFASAREVPLAAANNSLQNDPRGSKFQDFLPDPST